MTTSTQTRLLLLGLACAGVLFSMRVGARSEAVALPDPKGDVALAAGAPQVAVFAGGCFWGQEAVFEHVKGVTDVVSGYAGGSAANAHYDLVGSGTTGHAETVKITYDPAKISYGQLLKVFFSVAHDPTQLNRQGPDTGSQYRSAVFARDATQKRIADAYIAQLDAAKVFPKKIVTQVVPFRAFYAAEPYHQDYARHNPNAPYILINDAPKVTNLKALLPALYVSR
jgi:peptide-methionine (S)-S-oxide reductase